MVKHMINTDIFKNIPDELKAMKNWCNWSYETRQGQGGKSSKPTKIPRDPSTGRNAKSNDPNTWCTFDTVVQALSSGSFDGIGFFFTPPYFGVDIDKMDDMENGEAVLNEFITKLGSYTEFSPSGKGIHCICKGSLPPNGNRKGAFEMYQVKLDEQGKPRGGRYFTMTGNVIAPNPVVDCTETIKALHLKYIASPQKKVVRTPPATKPPTQQQLVMHSPLSSSELITKACASKNGSKFESLLRGDWQTLGYSSQSEGDQAFCNYLAFWTNKDYHLMDSIFRSSGLYRKKWDELRGENTYGFLCLRRAIDNCNEGYTGESQHKKATEKQTVTSGGKTNGRPQKEIPSLEVIEETLKGFGVSVAFDVIKQDIDITTTNSHYETFDHCVNELFRELKPNGYACSIELIARFTDELAQIYKFNPFLRALEKGEWDGIDRLPQLFDILRLEKDDHLSRTLLHKWLLQVVSLQFNSIKAPFGGEGCLVLVGSQGIGKSEFFRLLVTNKHLPLDLCGGEKWIDVRDKDTVIRNLRYLITEFSEIESSLRGDKERLKAFLSTAIDEIRLPYASRDRKTPRHTSFCGTCNSTDFLKDTENRRFWTIPLDYKVDLINLRKLDTYPIWLQIYHQVKQLGHITCFRLTDQERDLLQERNQEHTISLKGEDEVLDILQKANPSTFVLMTISDFIKKYPHISHFTAKQIGQILDKNDIKQIKNKLGRFRYLPDFIN